MSDVRAPSPPPSAAAAGHETLKRSQRFRHAANAVKLTAEQRHRQAAVTAAVWAAFGAREAAMAFFNEHSETLGGRPLDIAIDSDDGLARVLALLPRTDAEPPLIVERI